MRRWCLPAGVLAAAAVVLIGAAGASAAAQAESDADTLRQAIEAQDRLVAVIERVRPAVVAVFRLGRGGRVSGSGSGILVDPDGYALTNYHVVTNLREVRCGLPDGHIYQARVVGRDPTGDIALLKLRGKKEFPYAPLGDSDRLIPGEWAIAMGNPFNLATDFKPTVTLGIVSGLNRYLRGRGDNTLIYTNAIQVDTSINPGNSGGPLFNSAGELVGINGRIAGRPTRGRVNVGAGFAISINQIKHFLPMLKAGRDVYHAQLGVKVGARDEGGVVVEEILPDTAAEEAGLEKNDVILTFRGETVLSRQHLTNMIGVLPAGTAVEVGLLRGGKPLTFDVELGGLPAGQGVLAGRGFGPPVEAPTAPSMPADAPKAEDVIAAYVKARGGEEAVNAVKGTKTVAEIYIYGRRNTEGTITVYEQRPDKVRQEFKGNVLHRMRRGAKSWVRKVAVKQVQGYDGAEGWTHQPPNPVTVMLGNDREEIRQAFVADRILNNGDRPEGLTLTYRGVSAIGERRVHVVEVTLEGLMSRWWFFDTETHLLIRSRHRSLNAGLWREQDLDDYRAVGDVKMPFQVRNFRDGRMSSKVTVKSVTVENGLKDKLFKAPK